MSFTNNKGIFEQIADRLADEIMAENYPPGGRIPSVREYAALLQVNTNTAIKGYELLAREGIIFNKRGMGFLSPRIHATTSPKDGRRSLWRPPCPNCSARCGCSTSVSMK